MIVFTFESELSSLLARLFEAVCISVVEDGETVVEYAIAGGFTEESSTGAQFNAAIKANTIKMLVN